MPQASSRRNSKASSRLARVGNSKDQLIGKIYDTALSPGDWIDLLEPISLWSQDQLGSDTSVGPHAPEEVEHLIAHLERAVRNSTYLHVLEDHSRLLHTVYNNMPWPMLMLDAEMQVVDANAAARQTLAADAPITLLEDGGLQFRDRALRHELARVIGMQAGRERRLINSAGDAVSLLCLPVEKSDAPGEISRVRAIVWVLAGQHRVVPPAESLQAVYGLTPAEGRLLNLLCKVGSLGQCAELLAVSIHTARSQMKAIMAKANVSSQIQLVSQAMAHSLLQSAGLPLVQQGAQERVMSLPDNRVLSWYEYGDPRGRPVLTLENLGSSIPDHERFQAWYREQGLRVILVVRPGYGISTARPEMQFRDLAADLRALCTHLGLVRPAMAAYCCGGAYALCAAALDPELFERIGVMSGTVPIEHFELDKLDWMHSLFLRLFQRDPRLFVLVGRLALRGVNRAPEKYFSRLAKSLGGRDRELLEQPDILERVIRQMRLRQFQGAAVQIEEYLRLQHPWGVNLADIRVPLTIWHGEDDRAISIGSARALAATMPQARFKALPGQGHFMVYDFWREFLSELLQLPPRVVA